MNTDSGNNTAEAETIKRFKDGMFCAESVVLTLASRQGIESPLLPAMATGFCGGMGHTAGPCGALTGAIMGLGLAFGRAGPNDTTERTYKAVMSLVRQFTEEFGATGCVELTGCHLGTPEGQRKFRQGKLYLRCMKITGRTAQIAADLIDAEQPQHTSAR